MALALIVIASISVAAYIVATIMIFDYLKKAGEKVNFLWLRLFMIQNAGRYRVMTREKTGRTGTLYYIWIISINLALICAIILFSKFRKF